MKRLALVSPLAIAVAAESYIDNGRVRSVDPVGQ